ncbi:hypothetical protein HPB48_006423 [Haemaphysalis longicornis]|uniref:Uncharacterized protein n=1 Tax=Haemaphysalis longicornis TaxID=44386 RepID=A0A9J6FJT0_HAELO|nr:hypothetical protein HPB48_006423 [Haemaphysalis longicornis]
MQAAGRSRRPEGRIKDTKAKCVHCFGLYLQMVHRIVIHKFFFMLGRNQMIDTTASLLPSPDQRLYRATMISPEKESEDGVEEDG